MAIFQSQPITGIAMLYQIIYMSFRKLLGLALLASLTWSRAD